MSRIIVVTIFIAALHYTVLSQLVINQVQLDGVGGANDEFVELLNTTSSPVSLAGYQLRYYASSGALTHTCAFSTETVLSVPGRGFFLIGSSAYDFPGVSADTIWTGGYSSSAGQLGLYDGSGQEVDGLAYGAVANNVAGEGTPSSAPSTDQALIRTPDGEDTNDNSADFRITSTPHPRNSGTPPLPIELTTLDATWEQIDRSVLVRWVTVSETNNFGFEVQRCSGSDSRYQSIPGSFLHGQGTTLVTHIYVFSDETATPGSWWYRLKQIDLDGTVHYTEGVKVEVATGANDGTLPTVFSLAQNYPNPFNLSTTITVALPRDARVSLEVYNTLGQKVAQLLDELMTAGYHSITFDASQLASGLYLYRMKAGDFVATKRLLLLK